MCMCSMLTVNQSSFMTTHNALSHCTFIDAEDDSASGAVSYSNLSTANRRKIQYKSALICTVMYNKLEEQGWCFCLYTICCSILQVNLSLLILDKINWSGLESHVTNVYWRTVPNLIRMSHSTWCIMVPGFCIKHS